MLVSVSIFHSLQENKSINSQSKTAPPEFSNNIDGAYPIYI